MEEITKLFESVIKALESQIMDMYSIRDADPYSHHCDWVQRDEVMALIHSAHGDFMEGIGAY